jgi:hypothetical protein
MRRASGPLAVEVNQFLRGRLALLRVSVQQFRLALAAQDGSELPAQVERVLMEKFIP